MISDSPPPPPSSELFAAFTMQSISRHVISPRHIDTRLFSSSSTSYFSSDGGCLPTAINTQNITQLWNILTEIQATVMLHATVAWHKEPQIAISLPPANNSDQARRPLTTAHRPDIPLTDIPNHLQWQRNFAVGRVDVHAVCMLHADTRYQSPTFMAACSVTITQQQCTTIHDIKQWSCRVAFIHDTLHIQLHYESSNRTQT